MVSLRRHWVVAVSVASIVPAALGFVARPVARRQVVRLATEGTADPSPPKMMGPAPPLKVAIAGGGVGGLTTALALLKRGCDVTVYEKTSAFARFGGPIQFASNALSTLKAIDERTFARVMDKFTFTGTRRCGIKDGLRSDGKFSMTPVLDPRYLWDKATPMDWFVEFPLKACADFYDLPYTGVIDRPDLQEILLEECRALKPDFIRNGDGVVSYDDSSPEGVTVKLASGAEAQADVLVGADGIWSAVRRQMYDEGELRAMSADGKTRQGCAYSGYTVYAGEAVLPLADYYDVGYNVYVGPKRYFVKSDVGQGRIQWYAFCAQAPGTKRAADSWEGTEKTEAGAGLTIIDEIKTLHEGWSEEITQILDATPPESVEQRDLYDRWPEFFRSWASGRVVLIGDAVHPMMPNLGQGGCQAIEDAYELGRSLAAPATFDEAAPREALQETLQDFYRKRVLRVAAVSLLSRLASDLIINAFDTPYDIHGDGKGLTWKSYLTFAWKPVLQFLIFPAQFLFLYSYGPSGGMGDLPKRLEAAWKDRHKTAAELAFAKYDASGGGQPDQARKGSFIAAESNRDEEQQPAMIV